MKSAGSMCRHCARPRCTHQFEWQALFTYDDLVRAVLAQQWAVAIICCAHCYGDGDGDMWDRAYDNVTESLAQLWPCAVDVVNEMLREA